MYDINSREFSIFVFDTFIKNTSESGSERSHLYVSCQYSSRNERLFLIVQPRIHNPALHYWLNPFLLWSHDWEENMQFAYMTNIVFLCISYRNNNFYQMFIIFTFRQTLLLKPESSKQSNWLKIRNNMKPACDYCFSLVFHLLNHLNCFCKILAESRVGYRSQ